MAEEPEITLESLNLKKPLEKMTAKELRQLAIDKIPQITGASGMSKEELLYSIKDLCGLIDKDSVSPNKEEIWSIKKEIKQLQAQKEQLPKTDRAEREKMRQRIKRLKNRTRRLAEHA